MQKDPIHPLRLLSALLQYPDHDLLSQIEMIETAIEDMSSEEMKKCIEGFLLYLKSHTPIHLQEGYTAAFDMNPSTTLNLTYQLFGDNEKRAAMLARLQQSYQDAGYDRTTGELPDYLPMMLEFLSVCPESEDTGLIWECLRGLEDVVDRLRQTAPPYAALLQPLVSVVANRRGYNGSPYPLGDSDRQQH
ncbi:MAG: nitrate reductase molybdenum cofactor assembly chaperone [Deltaproteobacteria bacterium]|nr:nitrate reductase molybdenum cofactor assembly chaperone [Deltaproteobacteria bacterium]